MNQQGGNGIPLNMAGNNFQPSNEPPNPNWRDELTVQDRARLVAQLYVLPQDCSACFHNRILTKLFRGNALRMLSPQTSEQQILTVARSFEMQIYRRSNHKVT